MTPETIAITYCQILANELCSNDLALVHSGVAYPDDFCDGNILMEEAFTKNSISVWDDADEHMRDDIIDIWNAAYDAAVARKFKA